MQKQQDILKSLRKIAIEESNTVDPERRQQLRTTFTTKLSSQAILKMSETLHIDRRVGSFTRWYAIQCSALEMVIMRAFEMGVVAMLFTVVTYVVAHLENGDDDEPRSQFASRGFVYTVVACLVLSFLLPELLGGTRLYRFRHDGFRAIRGNHEAEASRTIVTTKCNSGSL